MSTDYTTVPVLAAELGITDLGDDPKMTAAITAASRQIDAHCGRFFHRDAAPTVRLYRPDDPCVLDVDDISTVDGLIVKTGSDGTFDTTITGYELGPLNAALSVPVWPYTTIELYDGRWPQTRRASVQVTARFGWPDVPADVKQACLIQAKNLYKAAAGTFAGWQLSTDTGAVMRTPGLDYVARDLLVPFVKAWVA